ncbi:MAG: flippase-like domain-containing protein [Proteobacteria bacterium]|nr:flippase-like domain-containing protein [Pseudomonadota bacterium]
MSLAGVLIWWAWQSRPALPDVRWHVVLIPGFALSLASLLAYAARFRRVLGLVDIDISPVTALRIVSFAVFCQFFLPVGGGAELGKFLGLRSIAPERRAGARAVAIVLEHVLGLLAVVVIACVGFALLQPFAVSLDYRWLTAAGLAIVALGGTVVLVMQRRRGLDARQVLAALDAHKGDACLTLLWSMLMHALLAAAVYVGSRGWDLAIGYTEILFVLASAAVFQAVPASIAGLGVADAAGTGLYVALGLPLGDALLLVSLLYGYRLLAALLGGAWELLGARWQLGKEGCKPEG